MRVRRMYVEDAAKPLRSRASRRCGRVEGILRTTLCVLALGAGTWGCAAARIELPPFDVAVEPPSPVTESAGARVAVEPFVLDRPRSAATVLGSGHSGFSKQPATIHLAEPIDAFLARTLSAALAAANVEPVALTDADALLVGTIEEFSVEEVPAGWKLESSAARVAFRAALTDRGGRVLWSAELRGHAESARVPDATASTRGTLEKAVREAVEAMLRDADFWRSIAGAASTRGGGGREAF